MAAALLAEAATAITTVMDFFHWESAAKFSFTLMILAIKGEVDGDPDRGTARLIIRDWNYLGGPGTFGAASITNWGILREVWRCGASSHQLLLLVVEHRATKMSRRSNHASLRYRLMWGYCGSRSAYHVRENCVLAPVVQSQKPVLKWPVQIFHML